MRVEGARGCLFLRVAGETGGNDDLTKQILVLFEGATDATIAAIYRGPGAVSAARKAARTLVGNAKGAA